MKSKRPIAQRISQWNDKREIIYKCPNCFISFNFYGHKEHFCHNCGQEINWNKMPERVSETLSNLYHNSDCDKQRLIMNEYNKKLREFFKEEDKKSK